MKKSIIILAIVILAIAGAAVVFSSLSGENGLHNKIKTPKTMDKVSIRLQWLNSAQFAGIYMAQEKGFYKNENLNVTINAGGMDLSPIKLVASGGDTFGIAPADQVLMAKEKNIPVKAIAVIYQKSAAAYASLKDSGITKPEDFAEKKVAVGIGSNTYTIYRALMVKYNIDTSKITEVPYKYDYSILPNKQVDLLNIYTIQEPYLLKKDGFDLNIIDPNNYGLQMYSDTLVASDDLINKNPDLVKRFLAATLKGWKYALDNQDETVATLQKYCPEEEVGLRKFKLEKSLSLIETTDTNNRIGNMSEDGWGATEKILVDQKLMLGSIDLNNVYTTKFLDEIYK